MRVRINGTVVVKPIPAHIEITTCMRCGAEYMSNEEVDYLDALLTNDNITDAYQWEHIATGITVATGLGLITVEIFHPAESSKVTTHILRTFFPTPPLAVMFGCADDDDDCGLWLKGTRDELAIEAALIVKTLQGDQP